MRLGSGVADERAHVDVGFERRRIENAGDVEPLTAKPDSLIGVEAVDAELRRRGGAEHGNGLARGAGVEPFSARKPGVEHGKEVQVGRAHLQAAGLCSRDDRATVDEGVPYQSDVRYLLDVGQERYPRRGFAGELRRSHR